MAVLEIVHYGDPILRKKCRSVKEPADIDPIISDMFDSMYEAEGIGLAANQVGLDMNLFIIDVINTEEAEETHIFINSSIVSKKRNTLHEILLEHRKIFNLVKPFSDLEKFLIPQNFRFTAIRLNNNNLFTGSIFFADLLYLNKKKFNL